MKIHPDRAYPLTPITNLALQIVDILQRQHAHGQHLSDVEVDALIRKMRALKNQLTDAEAAIDAMLATLEATEAA